MKKKWVTKTLSLLLASCVGFSALPSQVLAAGTPDETSGNQRFFIISEEQPDMELTQKVSLVSREFAAKDACDSAELLYGSEALAQEGDILVELSDALRSDSYEIALEDGKTSVTAGSPVSAMYGLRAILKSTLLGQAPAAVSETPDVEQRIFHLDCGRKYFTKDWIISLIKDLSWLQMNQLEVDFSNGTGFRLALDDMSLDIDGDGTADKDLSVLPGGVTDPDSYLTESEMDEIIDTANAYGVEIIPCLDTPGHTGWIFSKEAFQEYSDNGDLDVENEAATAFMKALVKKYAAYFVSKGCTTFHIGGDEYLHGYFNWGTPNPSTEHLYPTVADYLDSLALELKDMGYSKIRCFNDPLYYNEDLTTHTYQNIDEASYWCRRMGGFNYAAPMTLASQGLAMINGHGDFYDILTGGDPNWTKPVGDPGTKKTPAGIYAQFHNNTFAGTEHVDDEYVVGSTYFLWCDDPTQGTMEQVAASLYPRLRAASAKMCDENASGTFEEFAASFTDSVGGFTASGSLQEVTLPDEPEMKSAADIQAAADAEKLLSSLGQVTSLKDRAAVEAARAAYNRLTARQKRLVSPQALKILTDAEAKIAELTTPDVPHSIAGAVIAPIKEQAYTGAALTPAVTVTFQGKTLTKDTDYTVSYSSNVNAGTATVTISGKGSYTGSKTASFTIAIAKGSTWTVTNLRYKVTSANTVSVTGAASSKTSAVIKASVKIGGKTFQITEIAPKAFQKDKKLKTVTIGKNVAKIGKSAFFQCKSLKTVKILSGKLTSKKVGAKAFSKISAKASVKVPKAKKTAYKKFLYKKGLPKGAKIVAA